MARVFFKAVQGDKFVSFVVVNFQCVDQNDQAHDREATFPIMTFTREGFLAAYEKIMEAKIGLEKEYAFVVINDEPPMVD